MGKKLPPIHPGRILLEDYIVQLNLNKNKLAQALRLSPTHVGQIVEGKRSITPQTAMRLGRFFKTTPDLWINLQTRYDMQMAEDRDRPKIDSEIEPYSMAACSKD